MVADVTYDLRIFKSEQGEIVDLDHFEPLSDRVKDQVNTILGQVDHEVHVQGIHITIQDLDALHAAYQGLDRRHGMTEVHP